MINRRLPFYKCKSRLINQLRQVQLWSIFEKLNSKTCILINLAVWEKLYIFAIIHQPSAIDLKPHTYCKHI